MQTVKRFTKADNGKLSKVLEYESYQVNNSHLE